jgi:hypothetical protein
MEEGYVNCQRGVEKILDAPHVAHALMRAASALLPTPGACDECVSGDPNGY